MASDEKGIRSARKLHLSDYGLRAATALNVLLPGQHRAKTLQRIFNVSERTAKYLLSGQHWTLERLSQAGNAIQGFDELIATPVIHSRLDALEAELGEIRRHLRGEGHDQ